MPTRPPIRVLVAKPGLDGREGLLLHLYHATYTSWKYAKAWQTTRVKRT